MSREGMIGPPRMLMISYYFPPAKVVGAQRIFRFYQSASSRWEKTFLITATAQAQCEGQCEVLADDWSIRQSYLRLKGHGPQGLAVTEKTSPWRRFLSRLADSFPFVLLLGDGSIWYAWRAYRAGKRLIEKEGITHLFASFRPICDHYVAFLLKRRFPHLIWIADFRDLPVDPLRNNVFWPSFQHVLLQKILQKADLLTTVSCGLAKALAPYKQPVKVLRNALNDDESNLDALQLAELAGRFILFYAGTVYAQGQDGENLAQALANLSERGLVNQKKLLMAYAGKDGAAWQKWFSQHGLSKQFLDLGNLSREAARAWQKQAQVNVLLTWSNPIQSGILSAKLFEYLAARKPILCLTKGQVDPEITALLSEHAQNALQVLSDEPNTSSLEHWLLARFEAWSEGKNEHFDGKIPRWEEEFEQLMAEIKFS
jgi:hypothetical protein